MALFLCLYSPVTQPLRKGDSSEMEMTEMSFCISWKEKKKEEEEKKPVLGNEELVQRILSS